MQVTLYVHSCTSSTILLLPMQTLYAQVQVSKIGSLSYAEDDGSHVIGFKVADPFDADSFACHVVECSSEVCGLV